MFTSRLMTIGPVVELPAARPLQGGSKTPLANTTARKKYMSVRIFLMAIHLPVNRI